MKKRVIFTVLVILTVVLTACGTSAAPTAAPAESGGGEAAAPAPATEEAAAPAAATAVDTLERVLRLEAHAPVVPGPGGRYPRSARVQGGDRLPRLCVPPAGHDSSPCGSDRAQNDSPESCDRISVRLLAGSSYGDADVGHRTAETGQKCNDADAGQTRGRARPDVRNR